MGINENDQQKLEFGRRMHEKLDMVSVPKGTLAERIDILISAFDQACRADQDAQPDARQHITAHYAKFYGRGIDNKNAIEEILRQ